jgi:hypothetical protein
MRNAVTLTIAIAALLVTSVAAHQTIGRPPAMPPRDPNQPQQMAEGTGSISGKVESPTGRPMRNASVRVSSNGPGSASRSTTTDDRGNFMLDKLPAGDYTLRASKPGYLESVFGQKDPGSGRPGTPISLKDGQRLEDVAMKMPKGGVITGTIVDDIGEPVFGVPVRALRWQFRNGERTLVSAGSGQTDDRGIYRIPTLVPGDYIVMATPPRTSDSAAALEAMMSAERAAIAGGGGNLTFAPTRAFDAENAADTPSSGYAPVFYPGTTISSTASAVSVGPAEEKTGIDVPLQLVPLGTVTGTVIGDPRVIRATSIQLSDANTGLPGLGARSVSPDANGKFTITGVAPGSYKLLAKSGGSVTMISSDDGGRTMMFMTREVRVDGRGGGPGSNEPPPPPMWAKADIAVDGRSKTDVALVLQPGTTVSGRIQFDGTGEYPTDFSNIRVVLGSAQPNGFIAGSAMATVNPDGTFRMADVMPGKYRVTMTPPRMWRARSVDVGGRDALDFLLDVPEREDVGNVTVTFTNRATELAGTITDGSGQAASGYTIVLFAADQQYWTPQSRRIVTTRPSTDGKFTFRDLPAGSYKIAALEDAEPGSWFDPELLKQLNAAAISVTIGEGERKTQDLRVGR